jgi:molybdenum cofactor cytidylyltransferase
MKNDPLISCLLLCAGQSTRMGQNKLLLPMKGQSIIHKTATEISKSNFNEVIVVTGHESQQIEKELTPLNFKFANNPKYPTGMHSSIKRGLIEINESHHFFAVCLGDQPFLTSLDYNHLINQAKITDALIVCPSFEGKQGNPVFISLKLKNEILAQADNDRGCFYLLERYAERTLTVPMTAKATLIDIDTPETYFKVI